MNKVITFTLMGKNKPGLVHNIFQKLYNRNANIEKSVMNRFESNFIISAKATIPKHESINDITNEYNFINSVNIDKVNKVNKVDKTYKIGLNVDFADEPGIIHTVSGILHKMDIDIETLQTDVRNAPISSSKIFSLNLFADVPNKIEFSKIEEIFNDELLHQSYEYSLDKIELD